MKDEIISTLEALGHALLSAREVAQSQKPPQRVEGEVIYKQFYDLKREIDTIKAYMGHQREGSSSSARTHQALEEILKNVKDLKQTSSPKVQIQKLKVKRPKGA